MHVPDKNDGLPVQGFWGAHRKNVMIVIVGFVLLGGCGTGGIFFLEGRVTLDGSPLEDGYITFIPEADTPGPDAVAPVRDGRFAITATGGPLTGTFRVKIIANRETDRKQVDDISGKLVPIIQQYIPARYNEQSELIIEVREDQPNEFKFALTSK